MTLQFLGTGTSTGIPEIGCRCRVCTSADPRDERLRTSSLINIDGRNILIDCGPDFRTQILRAMKKNTIDNLDAVLLTHEHYDHTGGLDDLRTFCRKGAVPVYAAPEVTEAIRLRLPYAFRQNRYPGSPNIALENLDGKPFTVSGVVITPIRIMHGCLPIYGFRAGNLAYLTDVKTIPEEEYAKLQNLDTLIINALRHTDHPSHQSIEQALSQASRICPQRTFLIHMSHNFGLHAEIETALPDNIFIAYDGLTIESN